jgi:hypothetical protein
MSKELIIIITSLVLGYIVFCIAIALGNDFGFLDKDRLYFDIYIFCWVVIYCIFHYNQNK